MRMTQPDINDIGAVYTPDQVAEMLSCSRSHVYRLLKTGALPFIDISVPGNRSRKSRIRHTDLYDYINGGYTVDLA